MPHTKSPLRYPGGKTQLAKFVGNVISKNNLSDVVYCEPYSGGFGAGLELLLSNQVSRVVINDFDMGIYSLWYAILNDKEHLIQKILETDISIENWRIQKQIYLDNINAKQYSLDLALASLFLNRTNRSGIIKGGPIGGIDQLGKYDLSCRFNKNTLIKKINAIYSVRSRIDLYNLEANDLIEQVLIKIPSNQLFIFLDPPYYKQGKNLYHNHFTHEHHQALRDYMMMLLDYNWIITYDYTTEIGMLYRDFPILTYNIRYSANRVRKEREYLIHSHKTIVESYDSVQFCSECR